MLKVNCKECERDRLREFARNRTPEQKAELIRQARERRHRRRKEIALERQRPESIDAAPLLDWWDNLIERPPLSEPLTRAIRTARRKGRITAWRADAICIAAARPGGMTSLYELSA